MDGTNDFYPDYDAEVAEVRRMKDECDHMSKEMLEKIDVLLARINSAMKIDNTDEVDNYEQWIRAKKSREERY